MLRYLLDWKTFILIISFLRIWSFGYRTKLPWIFTIDVMFRLFYNLIICSWPWAIYRISPYFTLLTIFRPLWTFSFIILKKHPIDEHIRIVLTWVPFYWQACCWWPTLYHFCNRQWWWTRPSCWVRQSKEKHDVHRAPPFVKLPSTCTHKFEMIQEKAKQVIYSFYFVTPFSS